MQVPAVRVKIHQKLPSACQGFFLYKIAKKNMWNFVYRLRFFLMTETIRILGTTHVRLYVYTYNRKFVTFFKTFMPTECSLDVNLCLIPTLINNNKTTRFEYKK